MAASHEQQLQDWHAVIHTQQSCLTAFSVWTQHTLADVASIAIILTHTVLLVALATSIF